MTIPEIIYRTYGYFKKKIDYNKIGYLPPGIINNNPKSILHPSGIRKLIELKEYSIFGVKLNINDTINWHQDILNNKEFPMDFSFSIDTRTGKHGNVKVVWEVNRLQFLSHICLKYIQTKESRYLNLFMNIIISWKEANPYLKGVNWYSNIELNIRIINWFLCWEILQVNTLIQKNEKFNQFVQKTWLPLIELHGMHAIRYGSKYSSSNNHLVAEASGLFIAGSYWTFKDSPRWVKKGQRMLEREIKKQHSINGINKEEASEYIQFITDFFLIAYLVGERTGRPFSESYEEIFRKIFLYIYHLMDVSGQVPYYGDDDDGKVFSLNLDSSSNNFQSLLTTAAVIFDDPFFKSKGSSFDLKNQILFGKEAERRFNTHPTQAIASETKLYENEGHFLIKKGNGPKEIYLHVDFAPLGYLSIAAHGHADALSFLLNVDGSPYIIDPGTYTYHSDPDWRAYFKGTIAHNTIRVDGLDQATNGGPCLWLDHYSPEIIEINDNPDQIKIKGSHNGYAKIGVTHCRSYTFEKAKNHIVIYDKIIVKDNKLHTYELPVHLHPEIEVSQLKENQFEIAHSSKRAVKIFLDEKLSPEVINGSINPILGWYSPSFLKKEPTTVIYSKIELVGSFELKTKIYL